jgi:hypothetical protein
MSEDLRHRIENLEQEVARLRGQGPRGYRYRSGAALGDLPLIAIATGPDLERGEGRGHARGVVAIGDIATGVLAIGGVARGLIALGGVALGGLTIGGVSLGVLAAAGGLAIGGHAVGGAAAGRVAMGGLAVGRYACGGLAVGTHVIDESRRDPEAAAFFRRYGIERLCRPR